MHKMSLQFAIRKRPTGRALVFVQRRGSRGHCTGGRLVCLPLWLFAIVAALIFAPAANAQGVGASGCVALCGGGPSSSPSSSSSGGYSAPTWQPPAAPSPPPFDWEAERRDKANQARVQRESDAEKNRRESDEAARRQRESQRRSGDQAARRRAFEQAKRDALTLLRGGLDEGSGGLKLKPMGIFAPTSQADRLKLKPIMPSAKTVRLSPAQQQTVAGQKRFPPVPSPRGYKSPDERRAMAAALSDATLAAAITRTNAALRQLQKGFESDVQALQGARSEAEQAEEDALMAGLNLLLAGALDDDLFPAKTPQARDLKFILERSQTTASQLSSFNKPPLEQVRSVMLDSIKLFREHSSFLESKISKQALKTIGRGAALAEFFADYGLAATRWGFAWNRTQTIVDNFDAPNGRRKAREALSLLQENLILEQKQRKGG